MIRVEKSDDDDKHFEDYKPWKILNDNGWPYWFYETEEEAQKEANELRKQEEEDMANDDKLPKLFELAGRIQGLAQVAKEKSNTDEYIIQRLIELGKESESILGEK